MKGTKQAYEQRELFKESGLIVYKCRGKIFLRTVSKQKTIIKPPATADNTNCVKQAQRFATAVIADPVQKALYETKAAGKCSAYNQAVAEYMLTH